MRHLSFVLATLTLVVPRPAAAQEITVDPRNPVLAASGHGEVKRRADRADITVGLQSRGSTPGGAASDLDRLLGVVRDTLRAQHIEDSVIVLGVREIRPTQTFPDRAITGYAATRSLEVRLRDLARLPQVLDALAGAGATDLSDIRYVSDHEEEDAAEAMAKAVAEATRRAEAAAKAAGRRLGAIVLLDANGMQDFGYYSHGYRPGGAPAAEAQEAVQSALVTIHWKLEGR